MSVTGRTARLQQTRTAQQLADLLEVDWPYLQRLINAPDEFRYYSWAIPKKTGGDRVITAPMTATKILQRNLRPMLDELYLPKPSAQGFVSKRSVVTNASQHIGRRWVFNIDLEDFFPSIHFGRVRGLLMAGPYGLDRRIATIVAKLCCTSNALPIGAPTSPVLSNMICRRMDGELQRLARKNGAWYTRYADDITFSTSRRSLPESIVRNDADDVELGDGLALVISSNGFRVNKKKVRLRGHSDRQSVTGLLVNEKVNVDRRFVREIRALLHSWHKFGLDASQVVLDQKIGGSRRQGAAPAFDRVVEGKIEYLSMVRGPDDHLVRKFRAQVAGLATDGNRFSMPDATLSPPQATGDATIRLVHISDLHVSATTHYDQDHVMNGLIALIQSERIVADAVLITGDLAKFGQRVEYGRCREWIEDRLAPSLGVSTSNIFMVPGNHDLDRSLVSASHKTLRIEICKETFPDGRISQMLDSPAEASLYLNQFSAYRDFHAEITQRPVGLLAHWSETFTKGAISVRLAGLNSALFAQDEDDESHLFLGAQQVYEVTRERGDVNISLMHHPPDHLRNSDSAAKTDLLTWSDIVLHGHVHVDGGFTHTQPTNQVHVLGVGATYQGSQYDQSFQVLTVSKSACEITSYKWRHVERDWIRDRNRFASSPDGTHQLPLGVPNP